MNGEDAGSGNREERRVKDTIVYIGLKKFIKGDQLITISCPKFTRFPYRRNENEWNEPDTVTGRCPKCGKRTIFHLLGEDINGEEVALCDVCERVVSVNDIIRASLR